MVEPIAVIGTGCRFPGGSNTPSKLWGLIQNPRDLRSKPPESRFNIDPFYHPDGTHHGTTNAKLSYWLDDSSCSNPAKFDAGFFNIQPQEVDAMDPQQRMLMEVVYDSLCAAGQPMEKMRGSNTAVYVGMMSDDWNTMLVRDWETLPRYTATGLERGIMANRISYFYGWHGPSMTVDTACSSSLVALDLAVQALRSGKCSAAVVAGVNLILSPAMYISESNLGMLSPNGRCAMWDATADGYARGEGVASVIVKTLSQAQADNDPIECIIREVAVNQDGRTPGLTMPSNVAQAALIRACYERAGLDPVNNLQDRPQFFHAHGTGTQAGDPQEAEAIASALFPKDSVAVREAEDLYIGSIKTVIGHTEGTAGLASLIGTSLALRHGVIPPNLHFQSLSPKVAPFFDHLKIPTAAIPWLVTEQQVRRASVNSFGFGGTNAHCILEEYRLTTRMMSPTISNISFTPLVFSAASESALRIMFSQYLDYLRDNGRTDLSNLAYTLQHRRSTLPYRKAVAAATTEGAISALINLVDSKDETLQKRYGTNSRPLRVLGIFTGQGAQWPRMGARLIESSSFAASRITQLDHFLHALPGGLEGPKWTIYEQLLACQEKSRISEAAISQPLCTAVQILLVDILRAAGVFLDAVVGHSSGEIGAAYAGGFISARDAICIAYLRGVHAKLAASPNSGAPRGAMIAVGTSSEKAKTFCAKQFNDRLQLAAVNSSSSVTLSGDEDAVDEAEQLFKELGTFARKLKVDTAYHSMHMASCAESYLASLDMCGIKPIQAPEGSTPAWYSSVFEGELMTINRLTNQYWVDNMCNTVLFAGALEQAVREFGSFDLAIEVGPHPALKGPATATLGSGSSIPYTGMLERNKDDFQQISSSFGYMWTQLGVQNVRLSAVQELLAGNTQSKAIVNDLPPYPFEHQRDYWISSRLVNHFKHRRATDRPNPVLGTPCSESTTPGEYQWRNILHPDEMPWLTSHGLQGQTVFPAMGYASMAIEATNSAVLNTIPGAVIRVLRLSDIEISRAIVFNDSAAVETIFSMFSIERSSTSFTAEWACYSFNEAGNATLNAKGHTFAQLGISAADALPLIKLDTFNLVPVNTDQFYCHLTEAGYNYSPPFSGVTNIGRKPGYSAGTIFDQSVSEDGNNLIIHPGILDSALQTMFAAWMYPGDTHLWSLHVPVSICRISINPYFTQIGSGGKQHTIGFQSFIRSRKGSRVVGDVYLHTEDRIQSMIQFEGVALAPFSPATDKDDLPMFSRLEYPIAFPDAHLVDANDGLSAYDIELYQDIDRVSYWFLRHASLTIAPEERSGLLPHFQRYLAWCDRMVDLVSSGAHNKVPSSCNLDTRKNIDTILARYQDRKDVRFVQVVGENLIPVIKEGKSMLEYMNQDGLLRAFYEAGSICSGPTGRWLSTVMSQISARYPGLNIFEVGAGTGATTSIVLETLKEGCASYTFTDISSGFFMAAEDRFENNASRMVFKTFDMEQKPAPQGFVEGSYDVVVAVNVLHVSSCLEASLSNIRQLLKPGGFLVVAELTSTELLFSGMTVGTLPGWWIGADTGRPWGPLLDLSRWDGLLKKSGFGGVDTVSPDISSSLPMSVFVAQALDDRVALLRSPLHVRKNSPKSKLDTLAIIGGETWPVYKVGQEISEIMGSRFQKKEIFKNLDDFMVSEMREIAFASGRVSLISLIDLDKPYLENITVKKFETLKKFITAGTILWVTRGSLEDTPYSYMMTGLTRTVKMENPALDIQMFDLDPCVQNGIDSNTAIILAEALLRQLFLHNWGSDELLWTLEPEIYVRNGRQLVTRLLPDHEKNERYNSQRRAIFKTSNPTTDNLRLVGVGRGQERSFELHQPSPYRLIPTSMTRHRKVRIIHSLLQTVAVGAAGFLRLFSGVDLETNESVLGLSESSESPAIVPTDWCIPMQKTACASTLIQVGANIVAEQILSLSPNFGTLLIVDCDAVLQTAIQKKLHSKRLKSVFIASDLSPNPEDSAAHCPSSFARHFIYSKIPDSCSVFVHFSRGSTSDEVRNIIRQSLPRSCVHIEETALLSHETQSTSALNMSDQLGMLLQKAYNDVQHGDFSVSSILLDHVSNHKAVGEPFVVVDWAASSHVRVKVQPIESDISFRDDQTYFFVGMAGELGQSLSAWMISRGARYIVLSSRNPKIHPRFISQMEAQYGAIVKAVSLDITSYESLRSVYVAMSATLPPIAGVINGAMILDDELFTNMTHEQFCRVTNPKVLGTQLLDEIFYDTKLDFFIVASSIASLIGWSGQSNYSAANEFMTSLVKKRRKRGLAASAMNIPAVLGVGYAAHSETFDFDYFQSLGYINISEEDLHILLAETIISGQSTSANAEVCMGVNYIPVDTYVKESHRRDIKFGHFFLHGNKSSEVQASNTDVHVTQKLRTAKDTAAAYVIIRDAFIAHLRRMLRMTEQDRIDESVALVEQGVDSLVAVDIRSWFMKELEVDVPTLKVMNGCSIADLVKTVMEKIVIGQETGLEKARKSLVEVPVYPPSFDPDKVDFQLLSGSETAISTPWLTESSASSSHEGSTPPSSHTGSRKRSIF